MADASRDHLNRPLRTLSECALHQRCIRLSCRSCGHSVVLEAVCLWWLSVKRRWPDNARIFERFYCGLCWQRRHSKITSPRWAIVEDQPTAQPFPPPDEREWKRLVSRYRS